MDHVRTQNGLMSSVTSIVGAARGLTIDWAFLFVAIWGAVWLVILIIDPGKLVKLIFEMGRQLFRVGPFRYGIWSIAKTKNQFRFLSGLICVGLIIFGILEGVAIK
jgi:hypothetical protein